VYGSPNDVSDTGYELAFAGSYRGQNMLGGLKPQLKAAKPTDRGGVYAELVATPGLTLLEDSAYPITVGVPLTLSIGFDDYHGSDTGTTGFAGVGLSGSVPLAFIPSDHGSWKLTAAIDLILWEDDIDDAGGPFDDAGNVVPIGQMAITFVYSRGALAERPGNDRSPGGLWLLPAGGDARLPGVVVEIGLLALSHLVQLSPFEQRDQRLVMWHRNAQGLGLAHQSTVQGVDLGPPAGLDVLQHRRPGEFAPAVPLHRRAQVRIGQPDAEARAHGQDLVDHAVLEGAELGHAGDLAEPEAGGSVDRVDRAVERELGPDRRHDVRRDLCLEPGLV
jgi:hypothetical protein